GSTFREYFVVNEWMIERWGAYTPEIRAELDRGIDALEALLGELRNAECELYVGCTLLQLTEYWRGENMDLNSMGMFYMASLAFQNPRYEPYADNLVALLEALKDVPFDDEPLEHDNSVMER